VTCPVGNPDLGQVDQKKEKKLSLHSGKKKGKKGDILDGVKKGRKEGPSSRSAAMGCKDPRIVYQDVRKRGDSIFRRRGERRETFHLS